MIKKLNYYIGQGYQPYQNLALEEYFLDTVPSDTCLLYLWQNQNTVVIGRNQNAWRECQVEKLAADGGFLARRPSGGGAVFHDLGNLNFTFLMNKENYDIQRQLAVILKAVQSLGIEAEFSGRNDLTYQGQKFSGNAFYFKGANAYHHGTLLMDVDMGQLTHYLQVDPAKLQSKGVASVRSRVMNLKSACPEVTVPLLQEKLIAAFGEVYQGKPEILKAEALDWDKVNQYQEKYASWDWRLGKELKLAYSVKGRFTWGGIEIQLLVDGGKVSEAVVYSDAMEEALIARLSQYFIGCSFASVELVQALEPLRQSLETLSEKAMIHDIQGLLRQQEL